MSRALANRLIEAAPAFAALGDPERLRLVTRLCREGPLSIVRLAEDADVSRQAVSKHLRVLENAGLVQGDRAGRERIWDIRTRRLAEMRGYLDEISEQWDGALARLQAMVES